MNQKLTEGSHPRAFVHDKSVMLNVRGDNAEDTGNGGKGKREHGAFGKTAERVKPEYDQSK